MLKKTTVLKLIVITLAYGIAGLLLFCSTGCEDNGKDDNWNEEPSLEPLSITPSEVTLNATASNAIFVANGGTPPFYWWLSDTNLGILPDVSANAITYTRTAAEGVNIINVRDDQHWQASAYIFQSSSTNN
jgi:hypothetical protein